jgi:hypothetical protein
MTNNIYKLRLHLTSSGVYPSGANAFFINLQNPVTSEIIYFQSNGVTDYENIILYRMNNGYQKNKTIFTIPGSYAVTNAQYQVGHDFINFNTFPSYNIISNVFNMNSNIYPSTLQLFQPVYTFGVYSSTNINLPMGDYTVSIGDLGNLTGTLQNEPVFYLNINSNPNWPIQSNTVSNYLVTGTISSTYMFDSSSQTYVPSNPLQYYQYNIIFNNLLNNYITTTNINFEYIFAFFNTSGAILSTTIQNNPYQIQLVFNSDTTVPPPANTPFSITLQNPSSPIENYELTGFSSQNSDSYLVNLTFNGNNFFNFYQSGNWTVSNGFYDINGVVYSIDLPTGIQILSNQLSTTLEIIPDTINVEVNYKDFTLSSLIVNNPGVLPNGDYEIFIGTFGPFIANVPYSPTNYEWEINIHNEIGITSLNSENYPLIGKIKNSSISNQNYEYNITFTPYSFITSSFVCYHKSTKVLCLIDNIEKFIPIYEITPGVLVKTMDPYETFVKSKYVVCKTIYNNPNIKNKINKLYVHQNENLILTGGHSLLEDSLDDQQVVETMKIWRCLKKIGNKFMCLACLHTQCKEYEFDGYTEIYHIVLESNGDLKKQYGIYVTGNNQGLWSESLSEKYFLDNSNMTVL